MYSKSNAVCLVSNLAVKGPQKSSEKICFSKFLWPMAAVGSAHSCFCMQTMPQRRDLKKTSLSNMKPGLLLKV